MQALPENTTRFATSTVVTLRCDEDCAPDALRLAFAGLDWANLLNVTFDLSFVSRGNCDIVYAVLDFLRQNPEREEQLVLLAAEPLASYLRLSGVDQLVPVIAVGQPAQRHAA